MPSSDLPGAAVAAAAHGGRFHILRFAAAIWTYRRVHRLHIRALSRRARAGQRDKDDIGKRDSTRQSGSELSRSRVQYRNGRVAPRRPTDSGRRSRSARGDAAAPRECTWIRSPRRGAETRARRDAKCAVYCAMRMRACVRRATFISTLRRRRHWTAVGELSGRWRFRSNVDH
jgi:hypothetical protein